MGGLGGIEEKEEDENVIQFRNRCPKCGGVVWKVGEFYFCRACGWNGEKPDKRC